MDMDFDSQSHKKITIDDLSFKKQLRKNILRKIKPSFDRVNYERAISLSAENEQLDAWGWDLVRGHFDCLFFKKKYSEIFSIPDLKNILCAWVKDGVLHKEDLKTLLNIFRENWGRTSSFRCCFRKLKGLEAQWWQLEASYSLDASGEPIGCSAMVFRIEEPVCYFYSQKEKLQKYETIVQHSQSVAWVWQVNSQTILHERRCWDLIGFNEIPNLHERTDVRWVKRIYIADRPRFSALLKQCLGKKSHMGSLIDPASHSVRYRIRNHEGEWVWLESIMFPVTVESELLLVGYHRIIDQLIHRQEESDKQYKQLKKSLMDKTRFLSEFAHELASPMQAIVGFAELCQKDERLSEVQQKNLQDMQASGKNLLKIVKSVLFTVKLQQGALVWSRQPVFIQKLIKEWYSDLSGWKQDCSVDQNAISGDVLNRMAAWGDFLRARQVLRGLSGYLCYFSKGQGDILLGVGISRLSVPSQQTAPLITISLYHSVNPIPVDDENQWHSPFRFLPDQYQSKLPFEGCNLYTLKTLMAATGGHLDVVSNDQGCLGYRCQWPLVEDNPAEKNPPLKVDRHFSGAVLDSVESNREFTTPLSRQAPDQSLSKTGNLDDNVLEKRRWTELMGVMQLQPLPSALWVNMRAVSFDEAIEPTLRWCEKSVRSNALPAMVEAWSMANDPLSALYLIRARSVSALIFQWSLWCHNNWIRPDEWLAVIASDSRLARVPLVVLVEDEQPALAQLEQVIGRSIRLVEESDGLSSYEVAGAIDQEGSTELRQNLGQSNGRVNLFLLSNPVVAADWQRLVMAISSLREAKCLGANESVEGESLLLSEDES